MFFAAEPDHREGNAAGVGVYKGIAQNVSRPLRRFAPRFCSCGAKLRLRFASKGRLQISAQGDTWGNRVGAIHESPETNEISLAKGGRAMRAPTRLWVFRNSIDAPFMSVGAFCERPKTNIWNSSFNGHTDHSSGFPRRGDHWSSENERISLAIGGRAMRAPTRLWEFCNTIPRRRCFVKYGQKKAARFVQGVENRFWGAV